MRHEDRMTNYRIVKDILSTGDNEMLRRFLSKDIDRKDKSFFIERPSLMHIAIQNRNPDALQILLSKLSYSSSFSEDGKSLPMLLVVNKLDLACMRVILDCPQITLEAKKYIANDIISTLRVFDTEAQNVKLKAQELVNILTVHYRGLFDVRGLNFLDRKKQELNIGIFPVSPHVVDMSGYEVPEEHPFIALKEAIESKDYDFLRSALGEVRDRANNPYLDHDKLQKDSLMNIAADLRDIEALSIIMDKISYSKSVSLVSGGRMPMQKAINNDDYETFAFVFNKLREHLGEAAFVAHIIPNLRRYFEEPHESEIIGVVRGFVKGSTIENIEKRLSFVRSCRSDDSIAGYLGGALASAEGNIMRFFETRENLSRLLDSAGLLADSRVAAADGHFVPDFGVGAGAGAGVVAGGGVGAAVDSSSSHIGHAARGARGGSHMSM